jgi:hypothetical protein
VGADPEPLDGVVFSDAKGAPLAADADGIHRKAFAGTDLLETEAGMGGITLPDEIQTYYDESSLFSAAAVKDLFAGFTAP